MTVASEQDAAQAILTFARESLGLGQVPEFIVFPDGDDWAWYFVGDGFTTSYVTRDGGVTWCGNQPAEGCNCPDCRAEQGLDPLPAGGLPPTCEVAP